MKVWALILGDISLKDFYEGEGGEARGWEEARKISEKVRYSRVQKEIIDLLKEIDGEFWVESVELDSEGFDEFYNRFIGGLERNNEAESEVFAEGSNNSLSNIFEGDGSGVPKERFFESGSEKRFLLGKVVGEKLLDAESGVRGEGSSEGKKSLDRVSRLSKNSKKKGRAGVKRGDSEIIGNVSGEASGLYEEFGGNKTERKFWKPKAAKKWQNSSSRKTSPLSPKIYHKSMKSVRESPFSKMDLDFDLPSLRAEFNAIEDKLNNIQK